MTCSKVREKNVASGFVTGKWTARGNVLNYSFSCLEAQNLNSVFTKTKLESMKTSCWLCRDDVNFFYAKRFDFQCSLVFVGVLSGLKKTWQPAFLWNVAFWVWKGVTSFGVTLEALKVGELFVASCWINTVEQNLPLQTLFVFTRVWIYFHFLSANSNDLYAEIAPSIKLFCSWGLVNASQLKYIFLVDCFFLSYTVYGMYINQRKPRTTWLIKHLKSGQLWEDSWHNLCLNVMQVFMP